MIPDELLDLGENLNWNLITRTTHLTQPTSDEDLIRIPLIHHPISTSVCAIGCSNERAKQSWRFAGWARAFIGRSPSSTSEFTALMCISQQKIYLRNLQIVRLPRFPNLYPYLLQIDLARWHVQMFLEIWAFDESDVPISSQPSFLLDELNAKLDVLLDQ